MHLDKLVIHWFVHFFYKTAPIIVFSAPLPSASLEPLWATILLGVVLVGLMVVDVVLVVHALGVLFRASLRLLAVEPVLALCLSELVDLGTGKTGEQFFRELVGYGLAWSDRVSLPCTRDTVGGREDVPSLR